MKKVLNEWCINAPWGEIALISWGDPKGSPILLVHGRQDSSAGFIPLLELLPDNYYYVALDLPGHGKSDPFPIGIMLQRFHYVAAISMVVDHLGWDKFMYLAHSMASELGLFYNAIYPNRVRKFILLDPGLSLVRLMKYLYNNFTDFYKKYDEYYTNYNDYVKDTRVYSKRKALDAVKRARGLTEEQAELILSRNLKEIGPDQYRLSWDKRLKVLMTWYEPEDYYLELFSRNCPPLFIVSAAESLNYFDPKVSERMDGFFEKLRAKVDHFQLVTVPGGHDVHITHPFRISKEICEFLETNYDHDYKSKL